MVLDEIDLRLLQLLQLDARKTTKELAAELGLTTTPVFERVKRLERQGVILRYKAVVDAEKLGTALRVFCTVSLKEHHREHLELFEQAVGVLDNVVSCFHIAGLFDYLLEVRVRDMAAYEHFIRNELAAIPSVGKVQSSFVMTTVKHTDVIRAEVRER